MIPLLSIVIANYNYGRFLEESIVSVLSQLGEGQVDPSLVELIIIDGGSTDNSVEVIRRFANGLPAGIRRDDSSAFHLHLSSSPLAYWVSEPDKGQSDAFNKGFAKARGRYLTWLNADDLLVKGCLKSILLQMIKHPDCEWFTGNFFRFLHDDGRICEIGWGPRYYPSLLQRKNSPVVVFGPSTFFSRKIYEQVGRIDERFHYMMDTDLWVKFMMAGIKQRRLHCFCWAFRMHEASKTAEFGNHKVSAKFIEAGKIEGHIFRTCSGYVGSRFLTFLTRLWRVLDGSFVELLYLKRKYIGKNYCDLSC